MEVGYQWPPWAVPEKLPSVFVNSLVKRPRRCAARACPAARSPVTPQVLRTNDLASGRARRQSSSNRSPPTGRAPSPSNAANDDSPYHGSDPTSRGMYKLLPFPKFEFTLIWKALDGGLPAAGVNLETSLMDSWALIL